MGSLDLAAFLLVLVLALKGCHLRLGEHYAFLGRLLLQRRQSQPKGL